MKTQFGVGVAGMYSMDKSATKSQVNVKEMSGNFTLPGEWSPVI